jgi:tetratricopeptide (TPR) repeat protein
MNAQRVDDIIAELHKNPDANQTPSPYVKWFPQFELDLIRRAELDNLVAHRQEITAEEIVAFTVSNKIPQAIQKKVFTAAREMAFTALKFDPNSFDGYIGLILCITPLVDIDTILCCYQEVISAMHVFCQPALAAAGNQLFAQLGCRPYIRALFSLASAATEAQRFDLATPIYEDLLRLDRRDHSGARTQLIMCYLKLIGRLKRVPSTQPVRTIGHLQKLLCLQWENCSLFLPNDFEPMKRWAEIFIAWDNGGDWLPRVEQEKETSSDFLRVVLGEVDPKKLLDDLLEPGFDPSSSIGSAKYIAPLVAEAMSDWPDFKIALHKKFGQANRHLEKKAREQAACGANTEVTQAEVREAKERLTAGRAQLRKDKYRTALSLFVEVKRVTDLMILKDLTDPETERWYLEARVAIPSNIARCAASLGHWGLARIECRFVLSLKPDHEHTYERLPKIASAHCCPELAVRLNALLSEVKANETRSPEEWQTFARLGIALLSLTTIIAARTGKLTEEFLAERMRIGISDMCTGVALPAGVNPTWLCPDPGDEVVA